MNKHLHVLCQLFNYALLIRGYSGHETNTSKHQVYNPSRKVRVWLFLSMAEELEQGFEARVTALKFSTFNY